MIKKLSHKKEEVASKIRGIFQVSYAVEAKILGAVKNFPPLKRPISSFMEAESSFFGYFDNDSLAGVIEIKTDEIATHIQSLVVDPQFFRRGIASALLSFALDEFKTRKHTVETGAANEPAIALYERYRFKKVRRWMTVVGIEKVALEKV